MAVSAASSPFDVVTQLKGHLNRIDDFMEHIRLAKAITPEAGFHAVFDHLLDEEAEHREAVSDALSNIPSEHRDAVALKASSNEAALSNIPAEHRETVIISDALPKTPPKSPLTVGTLYGQVQ